MLCHYEIIYYSPTPETVFGRASGHPLPLGRSKRDGYDTYLVISNVQEEDEGEYICYGLNAVGRSENVNIFLNVQGETLLIGVVRLQCNSST